jgi:hypothetical protein
MVIHRRVMAESYLVLHMKVNEFFKFSVETVIMKAARSFMDRGDYLFETETIDYACESVAVGAINQQVDISFTGGPTVPFPVPFPLTIENGFPLELGTEPLNQATCRFFFKFVHDYFNVFAQRELSVNEAVQHTFLPRS